LGVQPGELLRDFRDQVWGPVQFMLRQNWHEKIFPIDQ
jgi:hypothetical protein